MELTGEFHETSDILEADLQIDYGSDAINVCVIGSNKETYSGVFLTRQELDDNRHKMELLIPRIEAAIAAVSPPYLDTFIEEYEEIMAAQGIMEGL